MMRAGIGAMVTLLVAGCGLIPDHAMDYRDTTEQPTMSVPNHLAMDFVDRYPVPPVNSNPAFANRPKDDDDNVPRPLAMPNVAEDNVASLRAQSLDSGMNPRLEKDGSGTLVLKLDGRFDRLWSTVTEAIADIDYNMIDLDRSIGTHYFIIENVEGNANTTAFGRWWRSLWLSDEETPENMYLLKMNRAVGGVYLSLQKGTDELANPILTEDLLGRLKAQLMAL